MTIVFVTTGAWGTGTGTPNSAAQVDGNFFDLDQRIVDLVADVAEGKGIDHISYTANSMTIHYTDGTSQVVPLPIAVLTLVGEWMNSKTYLRGQMVTFTPLGIFQVLQDHTTPPPPAVFDPNAVDGSGNPLYLMFMPLQDINYDASIFVPGSVQRVANELMYQGIVNRNMRLPLGNADCFAYLDVGNNAIGATDIIIAIQKNGVEIGTITFAAGGTIDAHGGQLGTFSVPADADFVSGNLYALRSTQSTNSAPSGLSVTLPFIRTE
jgi:hypothetical protein